MSPTKILITGATGYIGGSVLTTLLACKNPTIKNSEMSVLVRKEEQATMFKNKGLTPILFHDLDDVEFLVATERKTETGKDVHMIHQSGTSSLGDRPITGHYKEGRVFNDEEDDIYSYLTQRENNEPYRQRTSDLVVLNAAERAGVKTYIIMSPIIYGIGSGFFNKTSIQIDAILRAAKRDGHTAVIGSGDAEWDHVHIEDLVKLHELILSRILAGDDIPHNKKGIYFNETGHQSWREVSERIAKEGHALGYLKDGSVNEVSLEDGAKMFTNAATTANPAVIELAFASRSRTRAVLACKIGWSPSKTREDFENSFRDEWNFIASEKP